jgi:hypothetical protein
MLFIVPMLLISASRAETLAQTGQTPAPTPLVARISAEDFGALPFMSKPMLSPSGTKVLARVFTAGELKLAVIGLGAAKAASRVVAIPDKRDLGGSETGLHHGCVLWRLCSDVGRSEKSRRVPLRDQFHRHLGRCGDAELRPQDIQRAALP